MRRTPKFGPHRMLDASVKPPPPRSPHRRSLITWERRSMVVREMGRQASLHGYIKCKDMRERNQEAAIFHGQKVPLFRSHVTRGNVLVASDSSHKAISARPCRAGKNLLLHSYVSAHSKETNTLDLLRSTMPTLTSLRFFGECRTWYKGPVNA